MATINESVEISGISLDNVEEVGYSAEYNWLYVRQSGDSEYYFVTVDGEKVTKGKSIDQKALDSSEANDKLDQLLADASDD